MYHDLPETNKAIEMLLDLAAKIREQQGQSTFNPKLIDLTKVSLSEIIRWMEENRPNDFWIAIAPYR